jgi:hypothetical protein
MQRPPDGSWISVRRPGRMQGPYPFFPGIRTLVAHPVSLGKIRAVTRALAIAVCLFALARPANAQSYDASYDGVTKVVLITGAGALLAWDGYLMSRHARTESVVLRDAAWEMNVIPFAVGGLMGHLFLPLASDQRRLPLGLAAAALVTVFDISMQGRGGWYRHPGLWFAVGLVGGSLTWGTSF